MIGSWNCTESAMRSYELLVKIEHRPGLAGTSGWDVTSDFNRLFHDVWKDEKCYYFDPENNELRVPTTSSTSTASTVRRSASMTAAERWT